MGVWHTGPNLSVSWRPLEAYKSPSLVRLNRMVDVVLWSDVPSEELLLVKDNPNNGCWNFREGVFVLAPVMHCFASSNLGSDTAAEV